MNDKKHSVPSYDHGSHAKPNGYTQRDWDRVVGWGSVPPEYQVQKPEETEKQLDLFYDLR